MTPTEFLRKRNVIAKDKTDLIIGFSDGSEESLIELLESYHQEKSTKCKHEWIKSAVKTCWGCEGRGFNMVKLGPLTCQICNGKKVAE